MDVGATLVAADTLRHAADLPDFVHTSEPVTVPICAALQVRPTAGLVDAASAFGPLAAVKKTAAAPANATETIQRRVLRAFIVCPLSPCMLRDPMS